MVELPDNERLPLPVRERLRTIGPIVDRNFNAFRERMGEVSWTGIQRRLLKLVQRKDPIWVKLRALYALVEDVMFFADQNIACRRGCAHCCHVAVAVSKPEAQMIGAALGRTPKSPPQTDLTNFEYGYDNPCTFLREGQCAIYEHRPLACRTYVSLDADALLCELIKGESIPVPNLDMTTFQWAYVQICEGAKMADIRQYFPRLNK